MAQEKGYRDYGHDMDNTDTIVDVGLSFTCDFEKEDLPAGGYDFVFLGNIIHGLNEEANQRLFDKIAAASSKVATIAILDQYSNVRGSAFVKGSVDRALTTFGKT